MNSSGNPTFDSLVQRYRQSLTGAAYHLCGNREAAFDIVQETLLDAFRGFDGLRDSERAGAWLFAILRRKVFAYRNALKPETELAESMVVSVEDSESLIRGIVIEQMSKLDEEDREILAGKYLLGLTYQELAESLGIKEGTVRVRCLRAKERLRVILRGAGVRVPEKR